MTKTVGLIGLGAIGSGKAGSLRRNGLAGLDLTLKSRNFGTDDFFIKAFARLA